MLRNISLRRTIFSRTTMELSTINPIPSASPPKLIWFNVRLLKYKRPKVAISEIGIESAIIKVVEPFRKKT